jgi:DNA-binding XRE family transcriptional regulator
VAGKRCALAERRRVVGHTQEQLAAALGVERTTVVRWEAGETCPQPWCRPKLAQALDVSVEELATMLIEGRTVQDERSRSSSDPQDDLERDPVLVAPWNHRGTVDAVVLLSGVDRVKRREFVFLTGAALSAPAHQWLVHEPGLLVSGLSGRRVSVALVDRLIAMIPELRAMDDVAGGGAMLALAEQEFGVVARLLDRASYDEATGGKLYSALAELGKLASWGAYDSGKPGLAQRYNIAALRAAHTVNDRQLGAHILGFMAYQAARQARPAEAVTLIETALAGVRGRETPALLAELYSKQADVFATLRDSSGCTAATTKARTYIEYLSPDDDLSYLYWVTPAEITAYAGQCLLQLGDTGQAIALLDEGIALFDESFTRNRQAYLTHVACAHARPGKQRDLDNAAARGMEAIDIAESLHSTYSVDLFSGLYHQMEPHAKMPTEGYSRGS